MIATALLASGCNSILGIDKPARMRDAAVALDAADAETDAPDDAPDDAPPNTARYWRFDVISHDASEGGGSVVLTEIEMRWGGAAHTLSTATLSTTDSTSLINPHPALSALADGNLSQVSSSDYVSFFDTASMHIDLGAPQSVESILIAPSGFNSSASTNPPLEWTLTSFNICSSQDGSTGFTCTVKSGITRSMWSNATLLEFAL